MSELQAMIRKKLSSGLKPTETKVTTTSGHQFLQGHDGIVYCGSSAGYVVDTEPDLQMAEVRPGLYFGSQDVVADWPSLMSRGITHILNLAGLSVTNAFEDRLLYKTLNWLDVPEFDIWNGLSEAACFIEEAICKGGRVFVHCNAGVSRAPTAVIAYLIKVEKLQYSDAMNEVKSVRPCACPNKGFREALVELGTSME